MPAFQVTSICLYARQPVFASDPRLPNRHATIGEIEARFFSWDFRLPVRTKPPDGGRYE
jgi:hypothetical protein